MRCIQVGCLKDCHNLSVAPRYTRNTRGHEIAKETPLFKQIKVPARDLHVGQHTYVTQALNTKLRGKWLCIGKGLNG